jgi:hypothetical protein
MAAGANALGAAENHSFRSFVGLADPFSLVLLVEDSLSMPRLGALGLAA